MSKINAMMTSLLYNIDIIWNFIFIARGNSGCRLVPHEPTSSLLMTQMSQYKILHLKDRSSKEFLKSTMLCAYPSFLYPASARYLASAVVSISRHLLIMRRPLPIPLATILANKYRSHIYNHLIDSQRIPQRIRIFQYLRMIEFEVGFALIVPNILRRRQRRSQNIYEGFSNFLWRGYEYEAISYYQRVYRANMDSMNLAICMGFQIWFSLLPDIMLSLENFTYTEILSPYIVNSVRESTQGWSEDVINPVVDLYKNCLRFLMQAPESLIDAPLSGEDISTDTESETLDSRGIRREVPLQSVAKKLMVTTFLVCLMSSVAYTNEFGTYLCHLFREGR